MPAKPTKKPTKKSTPKTVQKKGTVVPIVALFIAVLVILSAGLMHYMQSKTAFPNLTYKDVSEAGMRLKVPKDWMRMDHFATVMFHDSNMNTDNQPAIITIFAQENLPVDFSSSNKMQVHDQLEKIANKLKSSSNSVVNYTDIEITDTGNGEVILADSTETYGYLSTVKKAVNVFMLNKKGEVKKVAIVVDENLYNQNRTAMYKIARSVRPL